jgi:adhesin/invasin
VYYRIDTWDDAIRGQSYFLQLNLGTAPPFHADHLLQIWVDSADDPQVTIVQYEYDIPYPRVGSFTSGSITGQVSNVDTPYSGFPGSEDTDAGGAIGVYDGTNYAIELRIPVDWYSSVYGGSITANGTGENVLITSIFTGTGNIGSVGTSKDTINNADEVTQSFLINTVTGETVAENIVVPWFTSLPLVLLLTIVFCRKRWMNTKH